jgi:hypothetical protein
MAVMAATTAVTLNNYRWTTAATTAGIEAAAAMEVAAAMEATAATAATATGDSSNGCQELI